MLSRLKKRYVTALSKTLHNECSQAVSNCRRPIYQRISFFFSLPKAFHSSFTNTQVREFDLLGFRRHSFKGNQWHLARAQLLTWSGSTGRRQGRQRFMVTVEGCGRHWKPLGLGTWSDCRANVGPAPRPRWRLWVARVTSSLRVQLTWAQSLSSSSQASWYKYDRSGSLRVLGCGVPHPQTWSLLGRPPSHRASSSPSRLLHRYWEHMTSGKAYNDEDSASEYSGSSGSSSFSWMRRRRHCWKLEAGQEDLSQHQWRLSCA